MFLKLEKFLCYFKFFSIEIKTYYYIYSDVLELEQNPDAIYVRGLCVYYGESTGTLERASKLFQHALKLAPGHKRILEVYKKVKLLKQKKDEANNAFNSFKYQESLDLYSEALNVDPQNKIINAKLFFNRAIVASKVSQQTSTFCFKKMKM